MKVAEDPVEFELDVYINPSPPGVLHLVQFPLRPVDRAYKLDHVTRVELTNETHRMTMFLEELMDVSTAFSSSSISCDTHAFKLSNYHIPKEELVQNYVGIFRSGELHLNPISYVQLLRPEIPEGTSVANSREVTNQREMAESVSDADESIQGRSHSANGLARRSLFFAERGCERSSSYSFIPRLFLNALGELESLLFAPPSGRKFSGVVPNLLLQNCPLVSSKTLPTISVLSAYSIQDQVYGMLLSAQVISLHTLRSLLQVPETHVKGVDALISTVLVALEQCSVLIHGVWVCQKDCVVRGAEFYFVREYIMLLFYRSRDGALRKGEAMTLFPKRYGEMVDHAFSSIAYQDLGQRLWYLRGKSLLRETRQNDSHMRQSPFLEEPDEIVHNQERQWRLRESAIEKNFSALLCGEQEHGSMTMCWEAPLNSAKSGDKKACSSNVKTEMGSEDLNLQPLQRTAVEAFVRELYSSRGVIHGSRIMPIIREERIRPNSSLRGLTEAQIYAALKPLVLVLSQNRATALRSWKQPELDEYRRVIIRVLRSGSASRETIVAAIYESLKKSISNSMFRRILTELCTYQMNECRWSFKTGLES